MGLDSDQIADSSHAVASPAIGAPAMTMGFGLNFISGRGLLTTRDRAVGPFRLKVLELEIPHIAFPFDVTGGAERFKRHHCHLRHLALGLDHQGLKQVLRQFDLAAAGFIEIHTALREGYLEVAGRFAIGDHHAHFTLRTALLLTGPKEMSVVFYDARVYGWLPIPAALLPVFLKRALVGRGIHGTRAAVWELTPTRQFLRAVMPPDGWKIPSERGANLVAAEISRGQMVVAAGPDGEPNERQLAERAPPSAAVRTIEGSATCSAAETALAAGNIHDAYDLYRDALEEQRGGALPRERLLQIGAADPELALETRQLAEEVLSADRHDTQALLALAAIAMHEESWGEANNRYATLAELAGQRRERYDAVAAELAAAAAARPVDPAGALAAYERAAARARDSVVAHQALFELRQEQGLWDDAAQAGERLVHLLDAQDAQREMHRRLGGLYLNQLRDFKKARRHFEKALKLRTDDPDALEGLAETYAARGEPARAAAYLARLAEKAETSGDTQRMTDLNLRLGEIWERWLADPQSAASRYRRVLDVDPQNRTARLRLAHLAEAQGELDRARVLYEDVLAIEEEIADPGAVNDLVQAYRRLATLTLTSDGPKTEAIACLERAMELDPAHQGAREQLARLLREQGEWGRLIKLLEEGAQAGVSPEEIRRSRLTAARIELQQRQNRRSAKRHLEQVLDVWPDDADALEMLLPILRGQKDYDGLQRRLVRAADTTPEPMHRAALLFQLAQAQANTSVDAAERARILHSALEANPYHQLAARALVELVSATNYDPLAAARAYERLGVAETDDAARGAALVQQAHLLLEVLSRPEEAEHVLQQALALIPDDVRPWLMLAEVKEKEGEVSDAYGLLSHAEQMLGSNAEGTNFATLQLRLASLAGSAGDHEAELTHLSKATATAGARHGVHCRRLIALYEQTDDGNALAAVLQRWADEGGISDDPELTPDDLKLRAAVVHEHLGHDTEAQALYLDVMRGMPRTALPAAQAVERLARGSHSDDLVVAALNAQLDFLKDPAEQAPLLERLLVLQIQEEETSTAEITALRLLEVDPNNGPARTFLAWRADASTEWDSALEHFSALILQVPPRDSTPDERLTFYRKAVAIAMELQPQALEALETSLRREFPEAHPTLLPLGEQLAQEQRWQALLDLRTRQLPDAVGNLAVAIRREIADILYRRFDRPEAAISYYADIAANQPNDVQARTALAEIYERLERWDDLAALLFALGILVSAPETALHYALQSSEIFADKLGNAELAIQNLRSVLDRNDIDRQSPQLRDAMRRFGLHAELAELLDESLDSDPDPEDGRLDELVTLLAGPVAEGERALHWCRRIIDAFPQSDKARRLTVDLLSSYPDLGDVVEVLGDWADARDGEARATIVVEMARHLRSQGNDDRALAVLLQAAERDPPSQQIIKPLVDRYTALGDWPNVLRWIEALATLTSDDGERNARLRRLVEVAADYADDSQAAIRGLQGITDRSNDETRTLGQLCIEVGDLEGLAQLDDFYGELGAEVLLPIAERFAQDGALDKAQICLQRVLERGDADDKAWAIAEDAWRHADRLPDLATWRLSWRAQVGEAEGAWLQLKAYAERVEAGDLEDLPSRQAIETALEQVDLGHTRTAWAAYEAARILGHEHWLRETARALEPILDDDDPRAPDVVKTRVFQALRDEESDTAVVLARRLLHLGDPGAGEILEQTLAAAGRKDELLALLVERATATQDTDGPLWLRIASLYAENDDWPQTMKALDCVAEPARQETWAALRYRAGEQLGDTVARAEGAQAHASSLPPGNEQADWLRHAARLRWWELGEQQAAVTLLQQAQACSPQSAENTLTTADAAVAAADLRGAKRLLREGLAVLSGTNTAFLWLRLADVCNASEDLEGVREALVGARENMPPDAELWTRLGDHARQQGQEELVLAARAQAYALDPDTDHLYLEALEAAALWSEMADVLATRATAYEGVEAADRFEEAAVLARDLLDDPVRAVDLFNRAVALNPTRQNVGATFHLAVYLGRNAMIVALGSSYLQYLTEDAAEERRDVLYAYLRALVHLDLTDEAEDVRDELVQRGWAGAEEKLALARARTDTQPIESARLFEEVASEQHGEEAGNIMFLAAQAWERANEHAHAAQALTQSLAQGVDTLPAHVLGLALFVGAARLASLSRVIDLSGDDTWPSEQRASARVELAQAAIAEDRLEKAHELLLQAQTSPRVPSWVQTMEACLSKRKHGAELARLWLSNADAWEGNAKLERLRRAAHYFQQIGEAESELTALQLITSITPNDTASGDRLAAVVVELGDLTQFTVLAHDRLRKASEPQERAELALRFGLLLDQHFQETQAGLDMLLGGFAEQPALRLLDAMDGMYTALGRRGEMVAVVLEHAAAADAETQAALLMRAVLVATELGDDEASYAVLRRLLQEDPAHREALSRARAHCTRYALWIDLIDLLQRAAENRSDASERAADLLAAADIARDQLEDAAQESALMQAALSASPDDQAIATRLLTVRIAQGDLDAALAQLYDGQISRGDELPLGQALMRALSDAQRDDAAWELRGWLATRHSESREAGSYRLDLARQNGDQRGILAEIEAHLALDDALAADAALLHDEAAQASLALGDDARAVEHWFAAYDCVEPAVEYLLAAQRVIDDNDDNDRRDLLVERALGALDELEEHAESSSADVRWEWLLLLGRALGKAGDVARAQESFEGALAAAGAQAPKNILAPLEEFYRQDGAWQKLVDLLAVKVTECPTAKEQAQLHYEMGVLWRDCLNDEAQATRCLTDALQTLPEHQDAQRDLGLLLAGRQHWTDALPLLRAQIAADAPDTPIQHIALLADCYEKTGALNDALSTVEHLIAREPHQPALLLRRVDLLESLGQTVDAEAQLQGYLQALPSSTAKEQRAAVCIRLADYADKRGDRVAAIVALKEVQAIQHHTPGLLQRLRGLYELEGNWREVAEVRLLQAWDSKDPAEQVEHFRILANIYEHELGDLVHAAAMLERAVEIGPNNPNLLQALLLRYEALENWSRYLVAGERFIALVHEDNVDHSMLLHMARAYEEAAGDLSQARHFYDLALQREPDESLDDKVRALAKAAGDFSYYVEAERRAIARLPDDHGDEKVERLQDLAEIYVRHLGNVDAATGTLADARALRPDDLHLVRRLADAYALDPQRYEQATGLYKILLNDSPLDADVLRILARLAGQMGQTDPAYCYYSALLVLLPSDEEAKRFVAACRSARSSGPQRPLTDTDRGLGLIHHKQSGPIEELFAPLARFAELTLPGDLSRRGISERDRLLPTDERLKGIRAVLEPLGMPQTALYLWRSGGFACEAELTGSPTILLGGTVASEVDERQRNFLVARTVELYRTGHSLCERLPPDELRAITAGLCLAVDPKSEPPGVRHDTDKITQIARQPMTEQIRSSLKPRVATYVAASDEQTNFSQWRQASLSTATRVAMLVACDLAEAIEAMLRLRGFDDVTEDQRAAVIRETHEEMDLFRFGVSDTYFRLRRALGLALRRSK